MHLCLRGNDQWDPRNDFNEAFHSSLRFSCCFYMTDWTGIEWNWYLMLKRSTCGFDKKFILQTPRLSTSRIEAPKWRCCCSSVDPAILSATTVPWRSPGRSVYAKWWVTHGKASSMERINMEERAVLFGTPSPGRNDTRQHPWRGMRSVNTRAFDASNL